MASVTEVVRTRDIAGVRRRFVGRYAGPASYAAGGDALPPGQVGMGIIERIDFDPATNGTNNHVPVYNYLTGKVLWFSGSAGTEISGGTDLSTFLARFEAIGY